MRNIFLCVELPAECDTRDKYNDEYFRGNIDFINANRAFAFSELEDANKFLFKKGRNWGIHAIEIPEQYLEPGQIENIPTPYYRHVIGLKSLVIIKDEFDIKPEDIKELYFHKERFLKRIVGNPLFKGSADLTSLAITATHSPGTPSLRS